MMTLSSASFLLFLLAALAIGIALGIVFSGRLR